MPKAPPTFELRNCKRPILTCGHTKFINVHKIHLAMIMRRRAACRFGQSEVLWRTSSF